MDDTVRLSLCMIVRDSARTLSAALESVRPWVDELVVVDTGSRDITCEIADSFGARLFEFPWCDDFSAARNESLKHAVGDWLFWMDSDDTISPECGKQLRELAYGPHKPETLGYVMQVHCPGSDPKQDVTVVDHVKLVRNLPELQFEFRIHEQLLPAIRRLNGQVEWTDLFVSHTGSDHTPEGRKRKQERDLRLLQLELAERPDHPFALFNLGMTLADMDRHAEAIVFLQRSVAVSEVGESHLRKAFALWIGSLGQIGRDEQAWEVCRQAIVSFPDDPELLFRRGIVAHKLRHFDEAEASYRAVFHCNAERHFSSRDRGITGFKARHNLALVYADTGRQNLAEIQWREAVTEMPEYLQGWRALGQSLVDQNRLTAAAIEAEQLTLHPVLRSIGLILTAEVAMVAGRIEDARTILCIAAEDFPDDADVLHSLCKLLFEHGPIKDALPYQERLAQLKPEDAAAHHNLATLRMRVGALSDAVASFERSLHLRPDAPQTQKSLTIARAALATTPILHTLGCDLANVE